MPADEAAEDDVDDISNNEDDAEDDGPVDPPPTKKARLSKATTMVGTAKVGFKVVFTSLQEIQVLNNHYSRAIREWDALPLQVQIIKLRKVLP